jgi:hypothetical protein
MTVLMSFLKPGALMLIMGSILLFSRVTGSVNVSNISPDSDQACVASMKEGKSAGYTSVTRYKDGFLAAGSDGRMDWISITGKITKSKSFPGESFNCVFSDDKIIIAAGDNRSMRISNDGELFRKIENGLNRNINSLTLFKGNIIAGADDGIIIYGDPDGVLKETKLNLKGNIVSVSSRISDCYGVTDEGEIIHTKDGILWDIFDFNRVYSGYYKTCFFNKVLVTENRIAVAGIHADGSPVLMFSNQGGVWTERPLNYTDDQGANLFLSDQPNDILYDDVADQFYLACNGGHLMQLPSCSHCNKVASFQVGDIEGISLFDNTMLIVGSNYFIKSINIR